MAAWCFEGRCCAHQHVGNQRVTGRPVAARKLMLALLLASLVGIVKPLTESWLLQQRCPANMAQLLSHHRQRTAGWHALSAHACHSLLQHAHTQRQQHHRAVWHAHTTKQYTQRALRRRRVHLATGQATGPLQDNEPKNIIMQAGGDPNAKQDTTPPHRCP